MPLLRLLASLSLLFPVVAVRGLTVAPAGGVPTAGAGTSIVLVEGRPAIAWASDGSSTVRFARAADTAGLAWEAPVTVVSLPGPAPQLAVELALRVVNGNPAICYSASDGVKYVRAINTAGSAWGGPATVVTGDTGRQGALEVVDGRPAIAFVNSAGKIAYCRASDADGTAWALPVAVDSLTGARNPSLKVVSLNPAIAWSTDTGVWYARAVDIDGIAWAPRQSVVPGNPAAHCAMEIVSGQPAILYYDEGTKIFKYTRANDATGAAWGFPAPPDPAFPNVPATGPAPSGSLAIIKGKPAIAYFVSSSFGDLRYVEATNTTGAAWGPPVTLDSVGVVGQFPSLLEVEGQPAVSYYDASRQNIKYLHALDPGTGAKWPADVLITRDTTAIGDGGATGFGNVAVGTTRTLTLAIVNPNSGSKTLTIQPLTLDGPGTGELSTLTPPAVTTIVAGTRAEFTVQYAPLTAGSKTATLHLTTDAESLANPYDVILTAESTPDIAVERPPGTALTDAVLVSLPPTAPGGVREYVFTVKNPGGAPLTGLSLTVDGTDRAEFSVTVPPAAPVAPGTATTFTLRHATQSEGVRNATLHLASNVAGAKNPFDIPLRLAPGAPDDSFHPPSPGSGGVLALRADGGYYMGSGIELKAYHADGSLNPAFIPPSIPNGFIRALGVQKDGKVLAAGTFTGMNAHPFRGLARLLQDGTLDLTFVPGRIMDVYGFAVQPNGGIVVAGNTGPVGAEFYNTARFDSAGLADPAFDHVLNFFPECVVLQPSGKIVLGGAFDKVDGHQTGGVARLNADGSFDSSFSAGPDGIVHALTVQADGKIWAAGQITGSIARLLADGAPDPAMTLTTGAGAIALALQTDGKCIVGGSFNTAGGAVRHSFARIRPGGSLDPFFDLNPPGFTLADMQLQADGKFLFSGFFFNSAVPSSLVRLENDAASTQLKTVGRTVARWTRSGSAVEVRDVTFDAMATGALTWTRLGAATRITGGWELSGLTLPATGALRAQGYAGNSLVESTTPLLTDLEYWRIQYFNTSLNSGNAADDADPDRDGLTNFTEFAFGLIPVDRMSSALPDFKHDGTSFTATFTVPEGRDSVLYRAERSATMGSGTWAAIQDTGSGGTHVFSTPAGSARLFVRFSVSVK